MTPPVSSAWSDDATESRNHIPRTLTLPIYSTHENSIYYIYMMILFIMFKWIFLTDTLHRPFHSAGPVSRARRTFLSSRYFACIAIHVQSYCQPNGSTLTQVIARSATCQSAHSWPTRVPLSCSTPITSWYMTIPFLFIRKCGRINRRHIPAIDAWPLSACRTNVNRNMDTVLWPVQTARSPTNQSALDTGW
jgi:hypothetical protein